MKKREGRVYLQELERFPFDLSFGTQKEPGFENPSWLRQILVAAAPKEDYCGLSPEVWAEQGHISGQVHIEKVGTEFMLEGSFVATDLRSPCSRCSDLFNVDRKSEFRLFFERAGKRHLKLSEDEGGDPDYQILDSDYIDLVSVFAEQLMIQEPLAECPLRKDDGSCTVCGKNPQFAGHCEQKGEESFAFSKLKDLSGPLSL